MHKIELTDDEFQLVRTAVLMHIDTFGHKDQDTVDRLVGVLGKLDDGKEKEPWWRADGAGIQP